MDEITVLLFLGFIFTGIIIGYPLGHIFGKREANQREQRREDTDILCAEVIE